GGFIPIIPFFFTVGMPAVIASFVISTLAHFVVGASKALVTTRPWWATGLEMTIVGIIEAAITYGLGVAFSRRQRRPASPEDKPPRSRKSAQKSTQLSALPLAFCLPHMTANVRTREFRRAYDEEVTGAHGRRGALSLGRLGNCGDCRYGQPQRSAG